jgi:hypothetical protein
MLEDAAAGDRRISLRRSAQLRPPGRHGRGADHADGDGADGRRSRISEVIPEFVKHHEAGADVVFARRKTPGRLAQGPPIARSIV